MCIVKTCQADKRKCGCGYLTAGQPCAHSKHRDEWRALSHKLHGDERDDEALDAVREVLCSRTGGAGQMALL